MKKKNKVAMVAGAVVAMTASGAAFAQTIGDMATAGAEDLGQVTALITVVFWVVGVALIGMGIFKLKKSSEGGGRDQSVGGALVTLGVGVALIAAPSVYQGVATTFGVDDNASISAPKLSGGPSVAPAAP